jgi:hypothetical protein
MKVQSNLEFFAKMEVRLVFGLLARMGVLAANPWDSFSIFPITY